MNPPHHTWIDLLLLKREAKKKNDSCLLLAASLADSEHSQVLDLIKIMNLEVE